MATSAEPGRRLDELAGLVGEVLGPSSGILVDQARIAAFAEATEDRQWIHLDAERAARSPYGTTIAHGFLTLSLLSRFSYELVPVRDAGAAVNYGLDRVRFPAPVRSGDVVRATAELLEVEESEARTRVRCRYTMTTDRDPSTPCCVADAVTVFLRTEES